MQADGNLVIYNDDVARSDLRWRVCCLGRKDASAGQISALTRLSVDGTDQWYPADVEIGRSGAFTWEIKGSSPDAAGQTTTATHNFVDADYEFGSRSVNVTFNLTSIALPAGHYSGSHMAGTRLQVSRSTARLAFGETTKILY